MAIVVSEAMLQQTQVARVIAKWEAFPGTFPKVRRVLLPPVRRGPDVGMGRLPPRAVNLHRSAIAVETLHDGSLPSSLGELMALPGTGPYFSRALLLA